MMDDHKIYCVVFTEIMKVIIGKTYLYEACVQCQ